MSEIEKNFREATEEHPHEADARDVMSALVWICGAITMIAALIFSLGFTVGRATASPHQDQRATAQPKDTARFPRDNIDLAFERYVEAETKEWCLGGSSYVPVKCPRGKGA